MGCRKRIHRGLLVGGLFIISLLQVFGQANNNFLKLHNFERSNQYYFHHPIGPPFANYIGVTDSFGIQRYMHIDSLMTLVDIGNDSIYQISGDSICFIDMADTTCVPADSISFNIDDMEICYQNGAPPVCFPWNQGAGNIYTIDGALMANRRVTLADHYLQFVQSNTLNGLQILPLSQQRMTAIQAQFTTANANTGIEAAMLELNNTAITSTERNAYIRYKNGTNIFSMGQEQPLLAFTFSDSTNLKNPVWRYHGGGGTSTSDSLVFWKRTKFRSTLLDKQGDPGTSGQVLSSTGTGVDWITISGVDLNGLFTSSNSNSSVIPSSFIAKATNSVTWLGNTSSVSHILRGATGSSSASLTFQNADTGTGADGTFFNLTTAENFQILQREDQDLQIGRSAGQQMYMPGTQGGAIYKPSTSFIGGPVVAYEGILNSANIDVTTQVTLNKNQNFINVEMGSTADTLFLPKIVTNYPYGGFSIESALVGESGVGQEYTITNFHSTDNVTICAFNETAGADDEIDHSLCISLAPGESIIVKCVRFNSSGAGIWFSYN